MCKKMMAALATVITFACTEANSQPVKTIKGYLYTSEQKPAALATVRLLAGDKVLQSTHADSTGSFIFRQVSPGDYRLLATMAGYKESAMPLRIDSAPGEILTLDTVTLIPIAKVLEAITVTGKKPFIEYKIDRTVINTEALISGTGLNTLEILERSPGVIVDVNGNISMSGKPGVQVLVDGRPVYLSGEQLAAYLKSLPASALQQIELMPNPPAKYEAAGTAGVINIRTKKTAMKGWSGTLVASAGYSRLFRSSGGLNFNHHKNKINLFGNLSVSKLKNKRILQLERNYFDGSHQLVTKYVQTAFFQPDNNSNNVKLGLDYSPFPKTTLGILFNGSFSSGGYDNPVTAVLYNAQSTPDSMIIADNAASSHFNNKSVNLNFQQRLDSIGSTLGVDADWVIYHSTSDQEFDNSTFYPDGLLRSREIITARIPADIVIRSAKADYSKVLEPKSRLESGIKTSYVTAENFSRYYTRQNTVPTIDAHNTIAFDYEEKIHAGYLNYIRESGRFSFQAGLRMESTDISAKQFRNSTNPDSAFQQRYTNVFPTAYFSYKLDSAGFQTLRGSYGRRLDRPYYKDLNPFIYIVDKYTYFSGNPLLQPQFASTYELTYRYKSILSASLFYNHYRRYQTEAVFQEEGIFISRPTNIGKRVYRGISATLSVKPATWWTSNIYTEVVNMQFRGQLISDFIHTSSTYFYIESGNRFDISKGWTGELSGFFISQRTAAQFNHGPKGQLSLGMQKRFWKNKASLRLAVADIFRTNINAGKLTHISGTRSTYRNDMDARMINLGFTYNFGNPGNLPKRRATGSSDMEQNRVKN